MCPGTGDAKSIDTCCFGTGRREFKMSTVVYMFVGDYYQPEFNTASFCFFKHSVLD